MRLGGSDVFATFVNVYTPRPGFLLLFSLVPGTMSYMYHRLGIISRVMVAQMSNATTKNMKRKNSLEILNSRILPNEG